MIPTIHTDRLVLRPIVREDFEPFADMMADPSVAAFLTFDGEPQTRAEAWRGLAMIVGCWTLQGFGMWAVEDRATGRFAGRVGPWRPEGWPGFEIGWGIHPDFQRRGYATEAAEASIKWAREVLGYDRIYHIIAPNNEPSQGVAKRLGARIVGTWGAPWSPPDMDLWATDR